MSDLGVLLDHLGQPVLPGSTLKGRLRSTCESLSHALGLTACLLDREASGIDCVSDVNFYRQIRNKYQKALEQGLEQRLAWIDKHTCDVCKLFGSPVRAARLRMSDGMLCDWTSAVRVRDGVVIDRDSHTAVAGLKYDYEVAPAGTKFNIAIDLENPSDQDLALLGVALFEWQAGSSLGGFVSRGLGRFHVEDIQHVGVDFNDPEQRIKVLTATDPAERCGIPEENWEQYYADKIEVQLNSLTSTQEN